MKRLLLIPLLVVATAAARDAAPAGLYESYSGFTVTAAPVLPAKEIHPALWFRADDLPALRARRSADEFSRTRWEATRRLARLDTALPAAPAATAAVDVIHKYYGALSIAARAHALVSLLADDAAERAAHQQRAAELLLRAYDGPIYQLDSKVKGSAVDEIYRGSWLQNYAHAYDCIQPWLAPDTDQKIRERLAREADCVYENLYLWTDNSPHNHLSKPAWGLGSMALTLSSDPRASAWLGRALEAANRHTRYFFSADGLYREGSHYLVFSLTNFLPFLYHYRNVAGVDHFPAYQPVFEAMVAARNSRGWLPNIEDSYLRPTPTHLAAAAYRQARTRLHSTAPLAEVLAWSYAACDLTPFNLEQAKSGYNYTGASLDYPLEIEEWLTHDPTIRATPPDHAPNIFLTGGQSYFRTGWTQRGDGQRYLLFHGIAVADNHNHDDTLSFLLEAEGQLMCSDSGYSRGTYAGAERTAWYNQPPAHNTLTFDGKPAGEAAPNLTPPSLFRFDEPGLVAETKEAVFGRNATWRRTIAWIAADYYVVSDRLNATRPGAIAAYLHGGRGALSGTGAGRTWTYSADRYGRAAQLHTWIAAPGASITAKSGELTYIKGDYAEFPYLEVSTTAPAVAWLTVLKPAGAAGSPGFSVRDLSTADYSAFAISTPDHRLLAAAQATAGKKIQLEDITSDGALTLVRRDLAGKLLNVCVLEATTLSVAGREVWHAATPANFASPAPR